MNQATVRRVFEKSGAEFTINERVPDDLQSLDTQNLFIVPQYRMIFDAFQRLSYTEINGFELRGYQVFQPYSLSELKELLSRYGISNS